MGITHQADGIAATAFRELPFSTGFRAVCLFQPAMGQGTLGDPRWRKQLRLMGARAGSQRKLSGPTGPGLASFTAAVAGVLALCIAFSGGTRCKSATWLLGTAFSMNKLAAATQSSCSPTARRPPLGSWRGREATLAAGAWHQKAFRPKVAAAGGAERESLKAQLLSLAERSDRGADPSQRGPLLEAFKALEKANPTKAPLKSALLKGEWELVWTTSDSILGLNRPRPFRPRASKPILQFLDPDAGYARNLEYTWLGQNSVEATIAPLSRENSQKFISRLDDFVFFKYGSEEGKGGTYIPDDAALGETTVAVRFNTFKLFGWLSIKAPETATGILQVTYLDEDLRLSRGDRGNLFLLRKVSKEKTG